MIHDDDPPGAKPVPVPRAVHRLIRQIQSDRPGDAVPGVHRTFTVDGEDWIARVAGEGTVGTGAPAFLAVIWFYKAAEPDLPLKETLLPRGRLEQLHEMELQELLRIARPLPPPTR